MFIVLVSIQLREKKYKSIYTITFGIKLLGQGWFQILQNFLCVWGRSPDTHYIYIYILTGILFQKLKVGKIHRGSTSIKFLVHFLGFEKGTDFLQLLRWKRWKISIKLVHKCPRMNLICKLSSFIWFSPQFPLAFYMYNVFCN